MDHRYKVGGYVKLAKLWERSKDAAVAYHSSYYAEKFRDDADKRLVGVYIDITGNKEIYKRPEMVHLLKDCKKGAVNLIFSQTRAYLCMLFDLEEAIMFTPKPQEYTDPLTGEMKKKQMKFFPDAYKNRIGKSYNDYIADHQMNMFEDFIGYQSSTVLDEPEREAGTTSIPIPQREESENIPLPDLSGQLENVQQSGNEIAKRGMPT